MESFKKVNNENDAEEIIKTKTLDCEIDLIRRLDSHNVPPRIILCIVDFMKKERCKE